MALGVGTRVGPYEILALLGVGGMGEVYRARDGRLQRDVALKVLPEYFAADPDRLMRFEREAQALAALKHANIAQIYGVEDARTSRALVMEFVDGPTLEEIIRKSFEARPSGFDAVHWALPIARQIADALAYAHARHIVHRDLKPSNVKLDADGSVKVLDFGLAKALNPALDAAHSPGLPSSNSPTVTSPALTKAGIVLGTAAYMSPEQARGKPVDERADVWAFGVVLFEMLTGRRLFGGESVSDTIAEVLKTTPDWTTLPAGTPAPVRRLLRRALEKEPERRLHAIADARLEIDEALTAPNDDRASPAPVVTSRRRLPLILAGVAVVIAAAAAGAAVGSWRNTPLMPEPEVFEISAPDGMTFTSVASQISPDGRHIAMVVAPASGSAPAMLWVRPLGALEARLIPGTESAAHPFWSPDSQQIGFFSGGALKRVGLSGGPPQKLCNLEPLPPAGATWNRDGVILFSPSERLGLIRVSENGGQTQAVISADPGKTGKNREPGQSPVVARWPFFLPDGRRFLFSGPDGLYLAALDDPRPLRIAENETRAQVAAGHLFFVRDSSLMAAPFDLRTGRLTDAAFPVADAVRTGASGGAFFSVSDAGTIVLHRGRPDLFQLVLRDRHGTALRTIGEPERYLNPIFSPNGAEIMVGIRHRREQTTDLTILSATDGGRRKVAGDGAHNLPGIWETNQTLVSVKSTGTTFDGPYQLTRLASSGTGTEVLTAVPPNPWPAGWSADRRSLIFWAEGDSALGARNTKASGFYVLPVDGPQRAPQRVDAMGLGGPGVLSPDGRWMAYTANEGTRREVFVQSWPDGRIRRTISTTGGQDPRWRGDGRELFYRAARGPASDYFAAITVRASGGSFEWDPPKELFDSPLRGPQRYRWDVTADGQTFVTLQPVVSTEPDTLIVTAHWRRR